MNKPFYKSTGVMGAGASIVGCLVALVASLASLKGLEITPENQALIVSLVMTLGGGVAALIGRLKASDSVGAGGILLSEMASAVGSAVEPLRPFPAPPEDDACPSCRMKFGAHTLGCPEAGPRRAEAELAAGLERLGALWTAQEPTPPLIREGDAVYLPLGSGVTGSPQPVFSISVPADLQTTLSRLTDVLERIHAAPEPFIRDQAGCPSKDPAEPMAEGQLVGSPGAAITNG